MKEDFKAESLAFISKVELVKRYDQKRWFNGAYSTLNARFTIKEGKLSKEAKETITNHLFSSIEELKTYAAADFNKWFYKTAKKITDSEPKLSFGHTQKLINILLKYHFVYFYSECDLSWNKKYLWLPEYFNQFHAPIDRKVLQNLSEKYSAKIPTNKLSWTKWQWEDKASYEKIQEFIQKKADEKENYYNNRLYFEMKELWKDPQKDNLQHEQTYGNHNKMKENRDEDYLESFLEEIITEVNKHSKTMFKINNTTGYFSIALSEATKNKNIVCFVKNEPVISINKCANISCALFDKQPFNKLRKIATPPRSLQLRYDDFARYPHNLEFDLKKDRQTIIQLCIRVCKNIQTK